jgi:hypothetical protein
MSASTERQASGASVEQAASSHSGGLRPVQIVRAIGAAVTFAATVTGLIFGLWPALRPAEPPAAKGATLTNATVDRASFGQYLDRTGSSRSPFRPAQLDRRGALVGFDFNIEGYVGRDLPLRWQLIDARTGEQVRQSRDYFMTPSANEDKNSWWIWTPVPHRRGHRFFVEIQLLDDRAGVPLGRIRTDPFSGP